MGWQVGGNDDHLQRRESELHGLMQVSPHVQLTYCLVCTEGWPCPTANNRGHTHIAVVVVCLRGLSPSRWQLPEAPNISHLSYDALSAILLYKNCIIMSYLSVPTLQLHTATVAGHFLPSGHLECKPASRIITLITSTKY
jgi:hypothetical protein